MANPGANVAFTPFAPHLLRLWTRFTHICTAQIWCKSVFRPVKVGKFIYFAKRFTCFSSYFRVVGAVTLATQASFSSVVNVSRWSEQRLLKWWSFDIQFRYWCQSVFKYHDRPIPVTFFKFGWAKIRMEKLLIQYSIEGWLKVQSSRLRRGCKTLMARVRGIIILG